MLNWQVLSTVIILLFGSILYIGILLEDTAQYKKRIKMLERGYENGKR